MNVAWGRKSQAGGQPLALNAGLVLPVDLEATYSETRDRSRL